MLLLGLAGLGGDCDLRVVEPGPTPIFAKPITDFSKLAYIVPSGSVSGNRIAEHSYLAIRPEVDTVNLYAPAAASVEGFGYFVQRSDGVPEYSVWFQVDSNLHFFFDHVLSLSPALAAVAPPVPLPTSQTVPPSTPVNVAAGELVATAHGTLQARTFDFGSYDLSNANYVGNPLRYYPGHRYITGICPYALFSPIVSYAYAQMFAGPDGTPAPGSPCRNPSRDVAGAASGQWFLDANSDATYGPQMALGSLLDGSVRWGGVGGFGWDRSGPLDPAEVWVGMESVYSDGWNYLYVKPLSETQMAVSYGAEPAPSAFPTDPAQYRVYAR